MFKRLLWFSSGAATGAAGSWWVRRRIQQALRRFTPGGMRDRAVARARRLAADAQIVATETRRLARDQRQRARSPR